VPSDSSKIVEQRDPKTVWRSARRLTRRPVVSPAWGAEPVEPYPKPYHWRPGARRKSAEWMSRPRLTRDSRRSYRPAYGARGLGISARFCPNRCRYRRCIGGSSRLRLVNEFSIRRAQIGRNGTRSADRDAIRQPYLCIIPQQSMGCANLQRKCGCWHKPCISECRVLIGFASRRLVPCPTLSRPLRKERRLESYAKV
jgi:hypothetical protein